MPRTSKRQNRRKLPAEMKTAQQRYDVIMWCKHELADMKRLGNFDGDPEKWHPVRKLVNILEDPTSTKPEMIKCAEIILEYMEVPKAAQLKLDAGGDSGDRSITIVVAPFASGKPAAPALPAPEKGKDENVFDL